MSHSGVVPLRRARWPHRAAWTALAVAVATELSPKPALAEDREDGVRVHRVGKGQILGKIALRYHVSVAAICRANAMQPDDVIRPGQRLVIPALPKSRAKKAVAKQKVKPKRTSSREERGAKTRTESESAKRPKTPADASWRPYEKMAWRRGYITLYGHGKRWSGYVIGPEEQVLPLARKKISRVLASWRTGEHILIDERLVRLIALVSDTFGGRPIRVVSGYRARSHAEHSRHKVGRAFDFSIPGVPNHVLRDYLRSLPNVGVGYYPNSTHIHLDVREGRGYWVDYSRPGQRPIYAHQLGRRARDS